MTTKIGYARVSKADGSQVHDPQRDALIAAGVDTEHIYEDAASGRLDKRPGLEACLKALRRGDTLVVWKLYRHVTPKGEIRPDGEKLLARRTR